MKHLNISRALTAIAVMLSVALPTFAEDFESGGIYYNITDETNKTVEVTYRGSYYGSYSNEYTGAVTIPSSVTYNGTIYSVTTIGNYAFVSCDGLSSVVIGESVNEVGDYAFFGCSSLTGDLTIPNSVTSISNNAFSGCSGLTSVTIGNSVTTIGDYAFSFCSGLTSVTIPNSVTSIGNDAFLDCTGLKNVNFNAENCTTMGYYARPVFEGCTNLKILNIGDNVKNIPKYAFYKCRSLTSVSIGNSVTSIGDDAFGYCSGLTSVTIPNSVAIGNNAFYGCSGLTEVNIIDLSAWCKSDFGDYYANPLYYARHLKLNGTEITNLVIPNDITIINRYAFYEYSGLTSVTIPNSVTSIGDDAFSGCSGAKSLIIEDGNVALNCSDVISDLSNLERVYIGRQYKSTSTSTPFKNNNKLKSITIAGSVTDIANYEFYGCTNLYSLTLGSGILTIGTNQTTPIKTIWLTNTPPTGYENVEGIVNYVSNDLYTELADKTVYPYLSSIFEVDGVEYVPVSPSDRTCDALDCTYSFDVDSIHIGRSVSYKGIAMNIKNVKPYTFYKNTYLNKATIDEEFNGAFGDFAFAECSNLDGINITNKVNFIGANCFEGCTKLGYATIGLSIPAINNNTFNRCSSLAEISIPQNVKSVGNFAFGGCKALKNVFIADRESILELGSNATNPMFVDCPLDSVYIGGNISYSIADSCGYSPFYCNTSLRAVKITDIETEVSENEFYGCTNLNYVSIGDGVESIGNWAFSGCSSLDYFAFGTSMKEIGEEAFSDCTAVTKIYSRAMTPPTCGTQALDDINKWTCELFVPTSTLSSYQAADQWKEFFFITEDAGIEGVEADDNAVEVARYDIHGRLLSEPVKGINIVKMSDGTVKKIIHN